MKQASLKELDESLLCLFQPTIHLLSESYMGKALSQPWQFSSNSILYLP